LTALLNASHNQKVRGQDREWRGKRFIFVSLTVTTVSIIFFFALKTIFPTIKAGGAELRDFARRAMIQGGGQVEQIEVEISSSSDAHSRFFETLKSEIQMKMESYKGQPFWTVGLKGIQAELVEKGWVHSARVRRSFPQTLAIQVTPRKPLFWVKMQKGWALVDETGYVMSLQPSVEGWLADLPVVVGMRGVYRGVAHLDDINRKSSVEREALLDLAALIREVESRLMVKVDSVRVESDPWFEGNMFTLHWVEARSEKSNRAERDIAATFLERQWSERMDSLQYVLSDLKKQEFEKVRIFGAYGDRWIVEPQKEK
jgi:hypothetical protein